MGDLEALLRIVLRERDVQLAWAAGSVVLAVAFVGIARRTTPGRSARLWALLSAVGLALVPAVTIVREGPAGGGAGPAACCAVACR